MKTIILSLFLLFGGITIASAVPDQYPSTGDEMLAGAKMWSKIMAHKCTDGDCKHFSIQDCTRGVAAFDYLKGYVYGFRIAQAATVREALVFPKEGLDCQTLIEPLIDFLEKNPEARAKHISIGLFIFLKSRFPAKA